MAEQCERALRGALDALVNGEQQAAYLVILRDQRIDDLEQQLDRLCAGVPGPAAACGRAPAFRLRGPQDQHGAGAHRRPRRGRGAPRAQAARDPPGHRMPSPSARWGRPRSAMLRDAVRAFLEADARAGPQHDGGRADGRQDAPAHRQGPDGAAGARRVRARAVRAAVHDQPPHRARGRRDPQHVRRDAVHVHRRLREAQGARGVPHPVRRPAQPLPQPDGRGHRHARWRTRGCCSAARASIPARSIHGCAEFLADKGLDIIGRHRPEVAGPDSEPRGLPRGGRPSTPTCTRRCASGGRRRSCFDWHVEDPSSAPGTLAETRQAYEDAFASIRGHLQDLVEAIVRQD